MKTELIQTGNQVVVKVFGRIDTSTSDAFRQETTKIDFSTIQSLVLDFEGVEYISSAGLRELLILRKKFSSGNDFSIINVSEGVMDVLNVTGLSTIINVTMSTKTNVNYLAMSCKDILQLNYQTRKDEVWLLANKRYTWADVENCSQVIAKQLFDAGVKKGTHVAICGANSVNWIFTFFATQKLGAIAVLLNSGLKQTELLTLAKLGDITHFCIGDMFGVSDYDALFASLRNAQNHGIVSVMDVRSTVDFCALYGLGDYSAFVADAKVQADDPAVMLFSSGTTGMPKGVLLSSFNVVFATQSALDRIAIGANETVCNILPFFHIFGLISGVFATAISNNELLLPSSFRTEVILDEIEKQNCTLLFSVPTMVLALINNTSFSTQKVSSLKHCVLGGAAVSEAQLYFMSQKIPNATFGIVYGLSELAPATMTFVTDSVQKVATSIGKPCNGVELTISQGNAQQADANGVGEILLRGDNLMTCYYKLDIDSQAFDDDGWLHTGDLGAIDAEGYVHIVGRIKELIIRGGENIIPNEVVSAISVHPSVADVKVLGVPDHFYGEIVVACVIPQKGANINADELNQFLSTRIAKFKIPAHYVFYNAFPLLPNGKVDVISLKKDVMQKLNINA